MARSLFSVLTTSARTPGCVLLETCKSSSIIPGRRPVIAEAVTPISEELGALAGPVNAYVNVGSSPLP